MRLIAGCAAAALVAVLATGAQAGTILLSNDTQGPIEEYTTTGAFIQTWGTVAQNATGPAIDEFGNVYGVNPNFGNNVIEKSNSSNVSQGTFVATLGNKWIEDMGYLGGGLLVAGTYEGDVYSIDQLGNYTLMFSTGGNFTGVTYDGTNLWTGSGFSGTTIYKRDLSGTILSSFDIGISHGGIGYDSSDGTLYIGGGDVFGRVYHYTTTGTQLGFWDTGKHAFVDGLEVTSVQAVPVPTAAWMGFGLLGVLGLAAQLKRRKSAPISY